MAGACCALRRGVVEGGGGESGSSAMCVELWLLIVAVFAPAAVTGVGALLPSGWLTTRVLFALAGMGASVGALGWYAWRMGGASDEVWVLPFVPSMEMDLAFRADALGLFYGLLVSGMGCLIVLYGRGYFGADGAALRRFYPLLGLFATAMMGLVLSDDLLGMFLFWELTSVSSFLLIGWERGDRRAARLALQALVVTGLGGMLLLAGVLAIGVSTDAWSFSGLEAGHREGALALDGLFVVGFVLLFAGGASKSAQWPVHFWLPGAMAAPTPVSAYLHSATMVKAGVYLFGRLLPVMSEMSWWIPMLVGVGATTMVLGAYVALRSAALKRVLAYSTVSQLGLLVCAYGLGGLRHGGEANLIYPVMQVLNHALYKAPLFIVAGAVMQRLQRKRLGGLRGLVREEPVLGLVMLGGMWALAGLPLTLSFAAKEAFLYQVVHAAEAWPWFWVIAGMAVVAAACNVAIFVRFARVFLGSRGAGRGAGGAAGAHERGFWGACVWWPAAVLVGLQFVGGVAPGVFWSWIRGVETHAVYWESLPGVVEAVTRASTALALSGVAIAAGLVVGFTDVLRRPIVDVHEWLFPAWMGGLERFGGWVFGVVQNGNLRTYLAVVLMALVGALAWAFVAGGERLLVWPATAPFAWAPLEVKIASVLLTVLICLSALALPVVRTRVVRVLILGIAGFSVTGMYIVYASPDLALTQIMFEIVSVVLFLLALRLLPEERRFRRREYVPARVVFSAVVGVCIAWVLLHAGAEADRAGVEAYRASQVERVDVVAAADGASGFAADVVADGDADAEVHANSGKGMGGSDVGTVAAPGRLGGWFLRNSYEGATPESGGRGGGGRNVVNVILVDFRGYDTLGEITVLAVTMMGVLALLGSVPRRPSVGARGVAASSGGQPHLRSFMLARAMLLLLPLIFLFAGYLFVKGHNEPGGGFIAGLVASVGLAAYRMSAGDRALKRLLPIKPGVLAACGLGLALATGFAPLVMALMSGGVYGGAFLMSGEAHVGLPGGGEFHWTSVLLFDLGVFNVVVAVTMGIVNRFEEELE